jgi:hypothetical protein
LLDGGAILFSSVVSSCVRRSRSSAPQPPYMRSQLQPMHSGCRTFSGHPPCWSRSLSPHMGGRSQLQRHGGVPGAISSRTPGRFHVGQRRHGAGDSSDTPLSPMRQTPLPNRPIKNLWDGSLLRLAGEGFVSHPRFPSLFSANHAVVFGGLCVPTPTPAFIGLLKPYGGPSPPHWGFIVPTRDGGSLTLPHA